MRRRMLIILLGAPLYLSGCGPDYSLVPPADSEKVTVTLKLPAELVTRTAWIVYRSETCKRFSRGASGQRLEQAGHQSMYKELVRQGESDLYQVELPKNGGGACKWKLANVTFGVTYADPTRFGHGVTFGTGGGITVIFDGNDSPRGGADIEVSGNLVIRQDYYPWLSENFINGYVKKINLLAEGYDSFLNYQAEHAREVYFEPVLHSEFVVRSAGPKMKKKGNKSGLIYPDGSVESVSQVKPDFYKLQTIRTGRARACFINRLYAKCPDRRPELVPDWLPDPEKPGYGRYLIVDEWGRELPLYNYRLIGQNGKVILNRTNVYGLTQPMPKSLHPLTSVEFPERTSAFP